MVRAALLALAMLVVASTAAAQDGYDPTPNAAAPDWTTSVEPMGWTKSGTAKQVMLLTMGAEQPSSGYRRIWMRYEYDTPQNQGIFRPSGTALYPLSAAELEEYDCAERRSRELQSTYYEQRNLQGAIVDRSGAPSSWTYTMPGTMGAIAETLACMGYRPPKTMTTR